MHTVSLLSSFGTHNLQAGFTAINTLKPRQNGPHLADDIFKYIFLNKKVWIVNKIFLNFITKGPIDNESSLTFLCNGLVPQQAIIWTNDGLIFWRIHTSLYLNELRQPWPFGLANDHIVAQWCHMVTAVWVNTGSGNSLLCDGQSRYLNQCWLIINKIQWHSSEGNFTRDNSVISDWNYLENYLSKISFQYLRGQKIN